MSVAKRDEDKVPFEEALNKTGFGPYNYLITLFASVTVIAYACVAFESTIIVPASACELGTTSTQQGVLASAPLIGSIIGALTWGYLGDTRGRRSMLMVSLALSTLFNAIASLSVNWIMLLVFHFTATVMASGKFTLSLALLSESLPLARRNVGMLAVSSFSMLSQGILSVIAIPIIPLSFSYYWPTLGIYWNSWRTLILVYCGPNIICFIWLLFMYESPKFLLAKGREEEALEVLRKIHRINKGSSEIFDVKGLLPETSVSAGKAKASEQFMPLFRPPLLRYTLCMATLYIVEQIGAFVVWLPTIANQYVVALETGDGLDLPLCGILNQAFSNPVEVETVGTCSIDVTALLIVFGISATQCLANLLVMLVVNNVGRRNLTIILTLILGVCGIIVNHVPNAIGSAVVFGFFLLGIMVLGLYAAMVVAFFPTNVRAMAISLMVAAGRLSTFSSILLLNYLLRTNCNAGFYFFAALYTSSVIIASFLPDDRKLTVKERAEAEPNVEKTEL